VYSQYGPFFYVCYDAFHRLFGFAWDNTSGRWITLGHWLASSALCAVVVARARSTWSAVLFVLLNTFLYLATMMWEPSHPGSLICTLVALAAWLGGEALRANRPVTFACATALLGTALALVKINVGIFLLIAAALWLALSLPTKWGRSLRFAGIIGLSAALPFALMHARLQETWVVTYAVLFSLSVTSCLLALIPIARTLPFPRKTWGAFAGVSLGLTLVIAGALLLRGSTWNGLLHGVLLDPLHHPGIYALALHWPPGVLVVAAIGLLLIAAAHRWPRHTILTRTIAWLRLISAGVFLLSLLPWIKGNEAELGLGYGLALAGLFVWPLRSAPDANDRSRGWLALLFVFQSLHAYPVAGSQISWGTFLWVPLLVLGIVDSLNYLFAARPPERRRWLTIGVAAGFVVFAALAANDLWQMKRHFGGRTEPLRLRGAEEIYVGADIGTAIRVMAANAEAHADVLVTLPGLYSFNLWTDRPTPTLRNATHWFSLLSDVEQRAIIARLDTSPRAVLIVQQLVLRSLEQEGTRPAGPLLDYLMKSFQPVIGLDSYSLWVRQGRTIAPLATGALQSLPGPDPQPWRLDLTLSSTATAISSIDLCLVGEQRQALLALNESNAQVSLTPLALDGQPTGITQAIAWPLRLPGISRLQLNFALNGTFPSDANLLAVLRDNQGRELGIARVRPPAAAVTSH